MFHHVINYQHVSITFAINIGVALQEYKEYNNLPHWLSGSTQCYNKFPKHREVPKLQTFAVYCSLITLV